MREPVFKKIVDGSLNLFGHILSPAIISALSSYISSTNLPLHTLILDDCQLSGDQWTIISGSNTSNPQPLTLTIPGAVMTRYESWFTPLLDMVRSSAT